MAKFRFLGARIDGERELESGAVMPNVVESAVMYGHKIGKEFVEIPDDAIAYEGFIVNKRTGEREWVKVPVVEKLRGNREFEEKPRAKPGPKPREPEQIENTA